MKYERFEQVPVWQDGLTLAERIFTVTAHKQFDYKGDLRSQLQRLRCRSPTTLLKASNARRHKSCCIYIARGSAGEVRSMLCLLERMPEFADFKSQISDLKSLAESISRQLRAWAGNLQDSPITGQRYLSEKSRKLDDQRKRAAAFLQKLKQTPVRPTDR